MSVRTFALIWGIVFLIIGGGGFLPGVTLMPPHSHPEIVVDSFFGYELGLFSVNVLHSIVHLLFGVWGLVACRSVPAARTYARSVAITYGALMIAGLIPGLNTMFGLVPLFGNDIWLHLILAGVAAYFGWVHKEGIAGADTTRS